MEIVVVIIIVVVVILVIAYGIYDSGKPPSFPGDDWDE